MPRFEFIPGVFVESDLTRDDFDIKGRKPRDGFSCSLWDIYGLVPSLDLVLAYRQIKIEMEKLNRIVCEQLRIRTELSLPPVTNAIEAQRFLFQLFHPGQEGGISGLTANEFELETADLLSFKDVYPFPLYLASPEKLSHSIKWIDSNIKVSIEQALPEQSVGVTSQIVESVFRIYCLLIKMNEFEIARMMNFNRSIFLQERILEIALGREIWESPLHGSEPDLESDAVLAMLPWIDTIGYHELFQLSAFMGIAWLERDQLGGDSPDGKVLFNELVQKMESLDRRFGIDDSESFLKDMGAADSDLVLSVILDDRGESVFDLEIMQRLLNDNPDLKMQFIVNRYPISRNIDLPSFETLVAKDHFTTIRKCLANGRVELIIEEQPFRSFELDYLNERTRKKLQRASAIYVKGASFFETFQFKEKIRYYCFVVYDFTSIMLTGLERGMGVFARIGEGDFNYLYESPSSIKTLKSKYS